MTPAEQEALDAARYRWLRGSYIRPNGTLRVTFNREIPRGIVRLLCLSLDDEIDAQMQGATRWPGTQQDFADDNDKGVTTGERELTDAECDAIADGVIKTLAYVNTDPAQLDRALIRAGWQAAIAAQPERARALVAWELAREACAKVCDDYPKRDPAEDGNGYWAAEECAKHIRALAAPIATLPDGETR